MSQLSTNYQQATNTYSTTWAEPGINCETCHGPSESHNRLARATPAGQPMADPSIISTKTMTMQQRNDLCLSCHAKAHPLTSTFPPGKRFFDHFDPITLEDNDYYPDGRDLGENYTFTSWKMSPCVKSGKLDCMHCHTSSGRYRFKHGNFNNSCMPRLMEKLKKLEEHTRHLAESVGSRCVSCHMPMTTFARMNRSVHSMLPPAPSAHCLWFTQCLQSLPSAAGFRLGRCSGTKMADPRFPGAVIAAGIACRCRQAPGLDKAARDALLPDKLWT